MDLAQTYDAIADDWNNEHKGSSWWMPGVDMFLATVPQGGSVLDVGCGPGFKAKYIADRGFDVTGTDVSERMVAIAKDAAPTAQFFVADVRGHGSAVPVRQVQFDGVMMFASLLHVPKSDVDAVLAEVARYTADHGVLYIVVKQVKEGVQEEAVQHEESYGKTFSRFFSYFTEEELRQRVTQAGFEVTHMETQPEGRAVWIHLYATKTQAK